jgi:beta-ureidopropionase / N-carbamoyl-L-amino-acid hydrolase
VTGDRTLEAAGVCGDRLRRDIEHLATFGATAAGGVSRTSFSSADRAVRDWLVTVAAEHGLTMRTDGIGNVVLRLEAPDAPDAAPVWTGSHLDSVPEGGRFDGVVGSVAALEVVRRLAETRTPLARPVEAVVFADEEGNYHHLLGSTALVRDFSADELGALRGRDGDPLIDALAGMGWDVAAATRTALPRGAVHAFVELHIEQGPVLESSGTDLGVVTSITGLGGGRLEFIGRQDHAGTTPMTMRRDPLRGAGAFLTRLPEVAAAVGPAAVVTCGRIDVEPGGTNVVPARARLQLDFRDPLPGGLLRLEEAVLRTARSAASENDLEVRYQRESLTEPIAMDDGLQALIEMTARQRGLSTMRLPSGAGHDSQNMARLAPTAMLFVPSVDGRSHSLSERSSWEHIVDGADVLLDVVSHLAQR